jgi:hypothetical protein
MHLILFEKFDKGSSSIQNMWSGGKNQCLKHEIEVSGTMASVVALVELLGCTQ